MRKKGISLCSKDLGPSNSLSKKKYSEPSSEICEDQGKYSTGLNNTTYKRMKAMSRSCNDKYDKNKKPSVTDKRKIAFTGYFVNDNIGRKELGGEPCIG